MFYLGIDVAKTKLDCCLLLDPATTKRKSKTFTNNKNGFADLLQWVDKFKITQDNLHAVMEGTGVYHEQLAVFLADSGVTVSIVNPAQIKDFGRAIAVRTKNDRMDSFVIARYGAIIQPTAWTPPPQEARILKALLARRDAINEDLQRELNRQEKSGVTDTPELICQSLNESINFLKTQLKKLQKDIDDHIKRHPKLQDDYELLNTIPGVGPRVASMLLSVIYNQYFRSAEQLAAYLGLVPVERQSGTSLRGKSRLSKTGPPRVRAVLYMAAVSAKTYNPHVKALYERLQLKGKTKMEALCAAMRKLVHLCFGVLKNQTPYQADFIKNTCA